LGICFNRPLEKGFEKYFKKMLKDIGDSGGKVRYLGYIDSLEELYKIYSSAKVIIQPSRFESFGMVVLENGSFANVIIASDIPSFRELTNNGKYGYLCKPDDVSCFIRKLDYALNNESELKII